MAEVFSPSLSFEVWLQVSISDIELLIYGRLSSFPEAYVHHGTASVEWAGKPNTEWVGDFPSILIKICIVDMVNLSF